MTLVDWELPRLKELGISARRSRQGPELDLIDWFLSRNALGLRRGERLTIFREPRLPSGFPDVVAVVWRQSIASKWAEERRSLVPSDLRLMHYLVTQGPSSLAELRLLFPRKINKSIERLVEAKMVHSSADTWRARALSNTFAATRIIAIEAKISQWREALDQALINTWFATESLILVPRIPRNSTLLADAEERGVGVFTKESDCWKVNAPTRTGPCSYVSWLFNDWAWKAGTAEYAEL